MAAASLTREKWPEGRRKARYEEGYRRREVGSKQRTSVRARKEHCTHKEKRQIKCSWKIGWGECKIKDKTRETHGIRVDLWGVFLRSESYKDTFSKKMHFSRS